MRNQTKQWERRAALVALGALCLSAAVLAGACGNPDLEIGGMAAPVTDTPVEDTPTPTDTPDTGF